MNDRERDSGVKTPMLLAGDVGGTKTLVALFALQRGRPVLTVQHQVRSREYADLEALLKAFLAGRRVRLAAACFGVAGLVANGRCEGTNLPWTVDVRRLQAALGTKTVCLLNDLEAMAYGIDALPARSFLVLNRGQALADGTRAVLAAGTGLGEALLVWDGQRYRAIPSEGGHVDFSATNETEVELWRYLHARFGHVSYERILSGPGKVALYEFLRDTGRGREPRWLTRQLAVRDPSPVISELAVSRRSPLCVKALELFVSIYGAEAGNLALKSLARGGVYVGGGIAPTILPILRRGAFMRAFMDKGRFSSLLRRIPVRVILEPRSGLFGAAWYAAQLLLS